jgi:hypothetical protein
MVGAGVAAAVISTRAASILALGAAGVSLASPSGARAAALEACPDRQEAAAGPLLGGSDTTSPADFASVPEACPGSDLMLRLRAGLLDDAGAPNFYGSVLSDVMVRGRHRIGTRAWLSLAADFFTFRFVDNANVVSTGVSFGPATLAYHRVVAASARMAAAAYARALLPIDTARQSGIETGAEIGATGRTRVRSRWVVDGGVGVAGALDVVGGQVHLRRLGPQALAEAWFSPRPGLAIVAGASAAEQVAPTLALLGVVPRAGIRGVLRHGWWLALLAETPLGGSQYPGAYASLFAGWTAPGP